MKNLTEARQRGRQAHEPRLIGEIMDESFSQLGFPRKRENAGEKKSQLSQLSQLKERHTT
ncbi:MAG: hypothetical protein J6M53_03990 [Bacteroidaceae bacterium]|nr:hypothetical protein [Bacteroidaceae bacterium]